MKELLELMLKCENFNCEAPFVGMLSLAFRNPEAIKNIYRFKWSFFAIENIDNVFYLICLPINCIEDYTKGNIDEVAALSINENDISLIDKELKSLQIEHL